MLRFTFGADGAALLACRIGAGGDTPRLELVIGERLTQRGLDSIADVWERARASLLGGQPSGGDDPSFLVLPCHDDRGFAGVVYLEGEGVFRRSRLALLVSLSPVVARVLRRLDGLDDLAEEPATTPPSNAEAASLHLLLDHNEWNVSRVARVLGVTRMTVYNRLRRFAIQRRRVPKHGARSHRHAAPEVNSGAALERGLPPPEPPHLARTTPGVALEVAASRGARSDA